MIECKIRRDKKCRIKANGTPRDLCAETLYFLNEMYTEIKNKDAAEAIKFRNTILAAMIDPKSPIFK